MISHTKYTKWRLNDSTYGYWQGKNLVFDRRVATPTTPATTSPAAICDVCAVAPWDDYAADVRCRYCRARMLVCPACHARLGGGGSGSSGGGSSGCFAVGGVLCSSCSAGVAAGSL